MLARRRLGSKINPRRAANFIRRRAGVTAARVGVLHRAASSSKKCLSMIMGFSLHGSSNA